MSTQLPFPLPVAAYGRAERGPRPFGEVVKIVGTGVVVIALFGWFLSANEPKKVHPTLRRARR